MTDNEVKQCAFDALLFFDSFCKEHSIKYWLCAGTLLGAIRHKGFIPWDDDIDVMLLREDYNRLCSEFTNDGRYQFLHSGNTKDFPYAFGKLSDTLTIKEEPLRVKYQKIGIDVDVFPIDNFPDDMQSARRMCHDIEREQWKMTFVFSRYGKGRNWTRTIGRYFVTAFWHLADHLGLVSVERIISRIQAISQQYNNDETGYCGVITLAHYDIKEMHKRAVFSSTVNVDFEEHQFPAPIGYHDYLTDLYGDYMMLPPEAQRNTHHSFKAYWK